MLSHFKKPIWKIIMRITLLLDLNNWNELIETHSNAIRNIALISEAIFLSGICYSLFKMGSYGHNQFSEYNSNILANYFPVGKTIELFSAGIGLVSGLDLLGSRFDFKGTFKNVLLPPSFLLLLYSGSICYMKELPFTKLALGIIAQTFSAMCSPILLAAGSGFFANLIDNQGNIY